MTSQRILLLLVFASAQLLAQTKPDVSTDFFNNRHTSKVLDLIRSNDRKFLYSVGLEGQIKQWDDLSGKVIKTIDVPNGYNDRIALSHDGTVVYAGGSKMIYRVDARTGDVIHKTDYEYLLNFQFSPAKNFLAVAHGYYLEILEGTTNKSLKTLPNKIVGSSTAVQFSDDGKLLAFTESGFKVVVYNTETWEQIFQTTAHPTVIMSIQFIENDTKVLIAPKFENVEIWSLALSSKLNDLAESQGERPVVFDPSTKKIIGFTSGQFKIWNSNGVVVSTTKTPFDPSKIKLREKNELYLVDGSGIALINYTTQKVIREYGENPVDIVLVRNLSETHCDVLTDDGKVSRLDLEHKSIDVIDSLPGFEGVQKLIVTDDWKAIVKESSTLHVYSKGKTSNIRIDPFYSYGILRFSRDEKLAGYNDQYALHLYSFESEINYFNIRDSTGIRSWSIDDANRIYIINDKGDVYNVALPGAKRELLARTGFRSVNNMDVTGDGKKMALVADSLVLYNLNTKQVEKKKHVRYLQEVNFFSNDTQLVTSGFLSKIQILSTDDFSAASLDIYLRGSLGQDVITDRNNQPLAFIDADQNLVLYDSQTMRLTERLENNVTSASFDSARQFAVYVRHRTLIISDLRNNKPLSRWCLYKNALPSQRGVRIKKEVVK